MKSQVLHTVWCHISCEAAGEFWHWSLSGVKGLRAAACKYREFTVKSEISDPVIFCPKKPFAELFSKIANKLLQEFSFSGKPPKRDRAWLRYICRNILGKIAPCSDRSDGGMPHNTETIFYTFKEDPIFFKEMWKYFSRMYFYWRFWKSENYNFSCCGKRSKVEKVWRQKSCPATSNFEHKSIPNESPMTAL